MWKKLSYIVKFLLEFSIEFHGCWESDSDVAMAELSRFHSMDHVPGGFHGGGVAVIYHGSFSNIKV